MEPIVSVLITLFNRERYLAECLDSLLASTYSDFEVIIVDDCSQDRSADIARSYLKRDPRIRFSSNEHNLGDYPNRNQAASFAKGKFLKYLDSDDIIYPHTLDIMVESMEKYPNAALGLMHSDSSAETPYPIYLTPQAAYKKHFLGRGCMNCGPSGAIIRRDAFESAGGFENWHVISDNDLWYRLAESYPIVLLPPGLVWWRRHEGQEFVSRNAQSYYLKTGYLLSRKYLQDDQCPLTTPERKKALYKTDQHHARRILSIGIRQMRFRLAYHLFRSSQMPIKSLLRGFHPYY